MPHTQTCTHALNALALRFRKAEKGNRPAHIQHTCSLTRALSLARTHKHTHPQLISTSLQKGQKRVTDLPTYNIRASSLARSHSRAHTSTHTYIAYTHTHTYNAYTSTHTDTYTFIRILEAETLTSRKNRNFNLTPEKEDATYTDKYTCTRTHALKALVLRFRKAQKRVTDKHTYIRARYARTRT